MIDRAYAHRMARYNRWMNGKLYDCAAQLSDAQRKEDRGAFFKSLHGTFNHLIYADQAWLNRFSGRSADGLTPPAPVHEDFAQMCAARAALDQEMLDWSQSLTAEWLAADFRYYSKAYEAWYTKPAWLLVTHLFNHQTHHRGQATTLLMQFGIDPGATDLPVLPY